MLADRAGVALDNPPAGTSRGPSKGDLLAVNAWAEGEFAEALAGAPRRWPTSSAAGSAATAWRGSAWATPPMPATG